MIRALKVALGDASSPRAGWRWHLLGKDGQFISGGIHERLDWVMECWERLHGNIGNVNVDGTLITEQQFYTLRDEARKKS